MGEGAAGTTRYDLILTGGRVFDPMNRSLEAKDVGIVGDRIALVSAAGSLTEMRGRAIDVLGKIVSPGWIDLHGHYYPGGMFRGLRPDAVCPRTGITTAVDAGSAGRYTLAGLRDLAALSATRLLAFLNLSSVGLSVLPHGGEFTQLGWIEVNECADILTQETSWIRGIKVRMARNAVATRNARDVLHRARDLADRADVPLMLHIAGSPVRAGELLGFLRAGDVATHVYHGERDGLLGADSRVQDAFINARARGVLFDIGHGGVNFDLGVARAGLEAGFPPDSISTDVHAAPPGRRLLSLPDIVSIFIDMGLSVEDALAAVTSGPAGAVRLAPTLGTLSVGAAADVTVLDLVTAKTRFTDYKGKVFSGGMRLRPVLTVRAGRIVHPCDEVTPFVDLEAAL